MGSPSIFVYDCSNAGLIVKSFKQFALQREQELEVRSQPVAALFVSVCAVGLSLSLFCYMQLKKMFKNRTEIQISLQMILPLQSVWFGLLFY